MLPKMGSDEEPLSETLPLIADSVELKAGVYLSALRAMSLATL